MNRRFRLGAVERLREARLDEAARGLALARRGLTEAAAARDAVTERLRAAHTPWHGTPAEVSLSGAHRAHLRERLAQGEAAVSAAAAGVADAMTAWRSARADLRAVQTLHQRHREAVQAADAHRDQLVLDDLAAGVASRRRLPGGTR